MESFSIDISRINLAHEFVLDRVNKCEYPHGRGSYGLVCPLDGKAEYRFTSGESFTVTSGDVLFLSSDAAYTIVPEKQFRHYTVNFDIHAGTSCLGMLDRPYFLLSNGNTEQLLRGFSTLVGIRSCKCSGYEMKAVSCLYELLADFYFGHVIGTSSLPHHGLIAAKEHIEKNFMTDITLDELARLSNMSITNFRREWKKYYSDSPIRYRDRLRISYARELIMSGYYTVAEVAMRCGFEDVSYFIRFFKKHTGITPLKYKQQLF